MKFYEKWKERFHIKSDLQMFLVLLTFTLTGSTIAFGLKPLIFSLLDVSPATPLWEKIIWWLLFVLPAYYIFLLLYGSILGQFHFFKNWILRKKKRPSL